MADIDDELIARALQWCGEAGRPTSAAEVREALAPLSWDELLAARALLADPPPAKPLGPSALAELARGAAPDTAGELERLGRGVEARGADETSAPAPAALGEAAGSARKPRGRRKKTAAAVVIRRARDRAAAAPPKQTELPLLDELQRAEGRSVLERLVRRHGGRRARIELAIAMGWRRPDGSAPGADEVTTLLETHSMTRAFERRERNEAVHAVRAAGGQLSRAATDLGLDVAGLRALLDRVGAAEQVEEIRDSRRSELRRRGTLAERARLVVEEMERLQDLELLGELEQDLRARLPDHLKAVRASGAHGHLAAALARSLALPRATADELVRRLDLEAPPAAPREAIQTPSRAPIRPAARAAPARSPLPGKSVGGTRPFTPKFKPGARPPSRAKPRPASGPSAKGGPPRKARGAAPRSWGAALRVKDAAPRTQGASARTQGTTPRKQAAPARRPRGAPRKPQGKGDRR